VRAVRLGPPDRDLDVEARPVRRRAARRRHDLHAQTRMLRSQRRHGGSGDVGAESVGRRHANDARDGVGFGIGAVQLGQCRLDPAAGLGGLPAEGCEFPAPGGLRHEPTAEGILESRDPPRDRRVVDAEECRSGRVPSCPCDGEKHQKVVRARLLDGIHSAIMHISGASLGIASH
jgi:hypothetical protein